MSARSAPGISRRGLVVAVFAVGLSAGCAGPKEPQPSLGSMLPEPDPRAELEREHDEFWSYLATTYDRDGDAQVARAEYSRDDASFANLDRDGDGAISRADFRKDVAGLPDLLGPIVLVRLAGGPEAESASLDEMRAALLEIDGNGDGRVARGEFDAKVRKGMTGIDRFGTLLAGMDDDGDELISAPELDRWLERRDVDADGRLVMRERDRPGAPLAIGLIPVELRETAPDFVASRLDRTPVALSSLLGKRPVALIFGSFT